MIQQSAMGWEMSVTVENGMESEFDGGTGRRLDGNRSSCGGKGNAET